MDNKLRVLMIGPDRSVHGGISAMVNSYYQVGLDKEVNLKYIGTMKESSKARKLGVAVLAYFRFLASLSECDIVHVNVASDKSFIRKSFFIKAAKRHGKKIVIHQHGGDFKNFYKNQLNDYWKKKVREILNMADVMLVLTDSWREYFGGFIDIDKIQVLPNGVVYHGDDIGAGPHDMNKVLFLGRICKEKGINELIDAVTELRKDHPDLKLLLGGIYEEPSLKIKVEENQDFIQYLGWVSGNEKDKYLEECGILVQPSYFEGFGISVVEGMQHGCVVVASEVGGIPEIIDDGIDGILVLAKDSKALSNGIRQALDDKELADKLVENAKTKVQSRYSMHDNLKRLVSIYREL